MMKTFPLSSRAKTTALKQPKELFVFGRDLENTYIYDEQKVKDDLLSYYYFPDSALNNRVDLGDGSGKFKKIPEEDNLGDFASFLNALMLYEKNELDGQKVNADVLTFRGLMTKLLVLPYNVKDPIDLIIVPFDGQLFIKSDGDIELKRRLQNVADQEQDPSKAEYIRKCEYSGYKFEALTTLPKPWAECSRQTIETRSKRQVNNYEQYLSVVRTGIGKVKLLLAGEVDAVYDYVPEDGKDILSHYVELKTSKVVDNPNQAVNFEKKLFKSWAQCFLIGIRKLVYGFRDDNLQLKTVEIYQTEEVPLLIKNNVITDASNKPKINCIGALKWYGAVVEWLHKEIDTSDESKSYRLTYDPGSQTLSLNELVSEENKRFRSGVVLTPEFIEWRRSLVSTE